MKLASKTMKMKSFKRTMAPILFGVACVVYGQSALAEAKAGADHALNKSASVKRDPFWPVGYTPEWAVNAGRLSREVLPGGNGISDWNTAMRRVAIQGVSSSADKETYAVINGEIRTVGDTVSVTHGSSTYTWAVESITPPSSVKLRRVSVK